MQLQDEPFHLLRELFQQHTSCWQQALPQVTKPQYAVLRAIAEQPGIEQIALMDAAISTKATLAELLARMEKRGLVRREGDSADKRRRFVWLTQEGEQLLAQALPKGTAVDNHFLDRLSQEQREAFSRLLIQMMGK
ncbi:MarR family transcriptional regulator [Shimwellia pseudoproteus]|uniref:MarR family winged helix-turn-helix transcriptional regulator n=1 Tax=Shimwellia pseudoproteus TaxID=570012 RepID=UPI0018ED01A4|nr:MarR family transcriptional regulator [Shimwellia pseudoproteus]MBJ3814234.1 MarR family transcriptional regulator [Shimwellia pseudoproteus]